jgi:hypothetical protein
VGKGSSAWTDIGVSHRASDVRLGRWAMVIADKDWSPLLGSFEAARRFRPMFASAPTSYGEEETIELEPEASKDAWGLLGLN